MQTEQLWQKCKVNKFRKSNGEFTLPDTDSCTDTDRIGFYYYAKNSVVYSGY